jgi:spore coat polysaccharide biosynthesis protein SpsF
MTTRRVEALIQARLSSRRLPGKVLRPLAGRPLIFRVVDRVRGASAIDGCAVVTSLDPSDDRLAEACTKEGVAIERGELDHVARRLCEAAERRGLDALVRVNGDSPFLDPELINEAVCAYREGEWDVVTNVFPRSFPRGQSVEVVRTAALRWAIGRMRNPDEAEHVTRYFYTHGAEFRIRNLVSPEPSGDVSLSVDTPEDWSRSEWIAARLRSSEGWREVLHLSRACPGALR